MTSGKKLRSLIKSLYIVAFAVPFLLTACAGSIEPGPMPTGYKYHNGTYKAPAGAEPAFWEKGGMHSQSRELAPDEWMSDGVDNSAIESQSMSVSAEAIAWLPAARELVNRIKDRLGYPVEPTFFEGMNGKTIPGFEEALKVATSEQGWPTAATRGSGPFHLAYGAAPTDPANPARLLLTVSLTVSKSNFVIEESGVYSIGTHSAMAAPAEPVSLMRE